MTHLKADGTITVLPALTGSLPYTKMQEYCGTDMIQMIALGDNGMHMILDEEGKLKDKPFNKNATILASPFLLPGDYIVGDVLVGNAMECGYEDEE